MTKNLSHKFVSAIADGADATLVRPSNWNADHNFFWGVRAVTITSDTIVDADNFTFVTYNNAGAVATSFPAPTGGAMPNGWMTKLKNLGVGAVTVTGTGGATFGGLGGSFILNQYDSIEIYSQNTTTYNVVQDIAPVTVTTLISSFGIDNLGLSASVASNVLTVSLVGANGAALSSSNQGRIAFRASTISTGSQVIDTLSAPVSLATVVGASLGTLANQAFRFWIVAIENSGAVALGLINCLASIAAAQPVSQAQIATLNDGNLMTSLAMSAGSTSSGYLYAASALSSRPIRVLGYLEYSATGLATPGTFTRAPDNLTGIGPGVRMPGDIVTTVYALITTGFSTVSSAFVASTYTVGMAPSSAANLIEVTAEGIIQSTVTGQTCTVILSRGTTSSVNLIGSTASFGSTAGYGQGTFRCRATDKPNSTVAQNYTLQVAVDVTSGSGGFPVGQYVSMRAQEIMA